MQDGHNRYANIEINYLLQRLEGIGGLDNLAANLKGAMDTTFLHRLWSFIGRSRRISTNDLVATWR